MASEMPPPPPPPTLKYPIGTAPPSDHDCDSESHADDDQDSDSDTETLSATSPTTPHRQTHNNQEEATERLLEQLKSAVEGNPSFANYCCGGSIPISTAPRHSPSPQDSSKAPITSPPVILRFDTPSGHVSKLYLPPETEDDKGKGKKKTEIEDLLVASIPELAEDEKSGRSSRGRSKRSSAKLHKDKFSVNLHPADLGIIDTITQILLPEVKLSAGYDDLSEKGKSIWEGSGKESWRERQKHWGVRAELSELSIYFSSSSNSQKQFDTPPRRGAHFGTLIVCLPSSHQGGGQQITHHNVSPSTMNPHSPKTHTTFHPTASLNPTLTWLAYNRTSSHTILPITCGHLITLTYNLYITEATGSILQRYPIADPRLYPLFRIVRSCLAEKYFLADGGTLAFHTTHPYTHTRRQTSTLMPYSLLGIDAIIFCVFRALGLKTIVAPILGDEAWDEYGQVREENLMRRMYGEGESGGDEEMDEAEDESDDGEGKVRVGKGWHRLRMVGREAAEKGWRKVGQGGGGGGGGAKGLRVGVEPTEFINTHYPLHTLTNVHFLNESSDLGWEIAMVNLKTTTPAPPIPSSPRTLAPGPYLPRPRSRGPTSHPRETETPRGGGSEEVDLMWQYSHPVIFVEIPAFGAEGRMMTSPRT